MNYADNAFIFGLIGVAYYHFRMVQALQETASPPPWWQIKPVVLAFRHHFLHEGNDEEVRAGKRLFNGFTLCCIYTILAGIYAAFV